MNELPVMYSAIGGNGNDDLFLLRPNMQFKWVCPYRSQSGVGGCSDPPGWMDPRSIHPRVFGPGGPSTLG